MRRIITLSIVFLLGTLLHVCFAQELKVKSFQVSEGDLIARTSPRNDLNGKPCAVILVGIGLTNVDFGGNLMGDPVYKPGEYLVYMPQGNTELKVRHANYLPLTVRFSDYGIHRLESGCTYQLSILSGNNGQAGSSRVQGNFLVMNVTPSNTRVSIDGAEAVAVDEGGEFKSFLAPGRHTYRVEADNGFDPQSGEIVMYGERIILPITLRSVKSSLTVSCSTSGARIYVNEKYKGSTQWQGMLNPGTYLLEARMEGYRSFQQTVTLGKQEERNFTFPALQPIYGSLLVDYSPTDAEVYVDSKLLGKSPNLFTDVLVGTHELKVVKEGYTPHTEKVTISENQQSSVSGKLVRTGGAGSQTSHALGSQLTSNMSKEEFEVNGVKFSMICVEGGTFRMGATEEMESPWNDEKPVHEVTLSTYYIGETEVTQALWQAVMGSYPSYFTGDNHPVENVSWKDCQKFITKLNKLTGRRFSLPTEAQWEYAARGGNKSHHTQYSGSKKIDDVAWYDGNSVGKTHPVGQKLPNELGLYDMSGNVWEWCSDWYRNYSRGSQRDPAGPNSGGGCVGRGGGWNYGPRFCRSSCRGRYTPSARSNFLGLRLALL